MGVGANVFESRFDSTRCIVGGSHISYNEINMKMLPGGEQTVSSDEAENVSDNSSMQPDVWAHSSAEQPHFPFTGKPGINSDLEDPSNPLEYSELFCTPDILEVIARETTQ
jgi:hypothetical protein